MENLEDLVNLEELYLSHNGLKKIEGLEKNVRSPLDHSPRASCSWPYLRFQFLLACELGKWLIGYRPS